MELKRDAVPSYFIPLFMIWVALCNIGTIITIIVFYVTDFVYTPLVDLSPEVILGTVLGINVLSIILLFPLIKMDPVKPFLIPAIIWFVVISAGYILFGLYWNLILGVVQLGADIWFHWMYNRLLKR